MKRRDFIAGLGSTASWPVIALAPQVPVVGYLYFGSATSPLLLAAFRKGLSVTGYIEGKNVAVEYRWANNALDQLSELAADLAARRVDVIVAPASLQAALAAKSATATIPIVFSTGVDPVQAGLVASLNRPGGNVTGVNYMQTQLAAKQLGLLHELLPRATRFAVLVNQDNPIATGTTIAELQKAASSIGVQVEVISASGNDEIEKAFSTISQMRFDGVLVSTSQLFSNRSELAALSARYAVPAIYYDREFAEVGGLMSYGSSLADQYRETGIYTGRILNGEKPINMPVIQPIKFELVINLKTAKALNLDISPSLLARADEVLE
ncbi:MAG: ABC transporter substrate-binding protein [Xanthobacteraceae bacterium]